LAETAFPDIELPKYTKGQFNKYLKGAVAKERRAEQNAD
jgi:hypothetical protein